MASLRLFGPLQSRMCLQGKSPSNRECLYKENHPTTTKSSSELGPSMCYKDNLVGGLPQAPSNDKKSLRKVPPVTTLRRPLSPCPLRDFLNTLLVLGRYMPVIGRYVSTRSVYVSTRSVCQYSVSLCHFQI